MTRGKTNERIRAARVEQSDYESAYRAIEVLQNLQTRPNESIKTLADIPDYTCVHHPDKETFGVRQILDIQDEQQTNGKIFKKFILGEYKFQTFRQIYKRIENIGRGLLSLNLTLGDKILIYSETRYEWLLTAFSAFRHGLTLVTLYSTLGEDAIKFGINQSKVKIVITSYELIPKLKNISDETEEVRYIIYFPPILKTESIKLPETKNNIQFISLDQLELAGSNALIDEDILKQRPAETDTAVIMYTSGSTGLPKGVLIRHENIIAGMTGQQSRLLSMVNVDTDIYIAYLPLAHILELCCEICMYYLGIKSGYSSPQTLTDQSTGIKQGAKGDLQILRPHLMITVPAILDRIHKAIIEKVNQSNYFRRSLFRIAYNRKVKKLEKGLNTPRLNKLIFNRLNQIALGGRLRIMMCGGASLNSDTQRFIQTALCVTLFQGYGLTETCAAATIADQYDTSVGRVGYPLVSCEIRLRNWDEGNYKNTDKPNPRGEILIGGKIVAQGYYDETSNENINFTEINNTKYFCTGDIGEMYPDGTLKIIDRKKDLVKLRSGEYVSLSKVEMVVNKFSIVENSCLYAAPSAEYTILLISPNQKEITNYAQRNFGEKQWQNLLDDEKFNDMIIKNLQDICKKNGIEKFETPQRIKIVNESWTPETGLVTDAFKLKRKAIELKYKDYIQQLYYEKPIHEPTKRRTSRVAPEPQPIAIETIELSNNVINKNR
ncbi:unnamed protein product [Adineta steineri]|uniref:long-chain-fatty-acid--CoA ligase n=1 Tax=Adineta steineri TaxID=433720 RepID=A0A819P775_9BILA|nr:unnamed protein product [Adineta steineri]CAF4008412.1 unnamed protein product [Adineta steineri]